MLVKDPNIQETIFKIADHYNTNIETRFISPLLAGVMSDTVLSHKINELMSHTEVFEEQGFYIDDLYYYIYALAQFIYLVRAEVLPGMNFRPSIADGDDSNKVFRVMALSNFKANIQILADYTKELFQQAMEYDKAHSGKKKPTYESLPVISDIELFLTEEKNELY
ncbi:hypothetical protein K7I13_05395 [Brucepastera parasyntrophica]|uniref:hypothetical protein n=1 Tax=Brucepastera parasyntrophica TaxID=2880008 RepID=UPI00210B9AB8|nr:hypothetical protein [Brucepastera parasyntrophica]ULQ60707.1 hypothetical protein K7I13_05395 [Brucepastera parasyntrophica]